MEQLREECDDSKRMLQDADTGSAYAAALEHIQTMETEYRSAKGHNVKLTRQLKSLTQSAQDPQRRQDEHLGSVETLTAELEATKLRWK